MKLKIRVCQGVSGVIVVTMVTGFMMVYNSSSGQRFPPTSALSTLSSSSSRRLNASHPSTRSPNRAIPALDGYTGVMDHKVSMDLLVSITGGMLGHQFATGPFNGLISDFTISIKLEPLKMHCRTCSLVTSSGQLIGGNRKEEIDRSECVIRMNDAPSHRYQQDVGQRTSVRVVAHSSLQRVLRSQRELINASQDTVFIFWGPSVSMRQDGKGHVYNNLKVLKQQLPRLKVYTISLVKMLKLDELFKKETGIDRKGSNSWLSTGWFTMAIALELCDQINVYGMVPPDFCRSSSHHTAPYHYYEPLGPDECSMYLFHEKSLRGGHHRFITEKMVFTRWAQTFNIHFHQPDWRPAAVFSAFNMSYSAEAAGT